MTKKEQMINYSMLDSAKKTEDFFLMMDDGLVDSSDSSTLGSLTEIYFCVYHKI